MTHFKIGFHGSPGGNKDGIGQHFSTLAQAGIPITYKTADDFGPLIDLINTADAHSVPAHGIFRYSTAGQADGVDYDVPPYQLSPEAAAAAHWDKHEKRLARTPEFNRRVWLEPCNEGDKNWTGWGRFAIAFCNIANSKGYKVAMFGWSSGEPEMAHWEAPDMLDFLRLAASKPDQIAVSIHEYSFEVEDIWEGFPYMVGRFQMLLDVCDRHGIPHPTIFISEWGWELDKNPPPAAAEGQMREVAALYADYPAIQAAHLWTLGAYQGTNIPNLTNALMGTINSLALEFGPPDDEPPPPPPPPPPPTADNLLVNGNFEGDWWHPTRPDGSIIKELQIPEGWGYEYYVWPEAVNPYDSAVWNQFVRNEVRILTRDFLPQSEWEDYFWNESSLQLMKMFFAAAWYARLFQTVDLPEGKYQFTARGFADLVASYSGGSKVWASYNPDDPFDSPAGLMRVNGSEWVVWRPGQKQEVVFELAGPIGVLSVEVMCPYALANSGFFFDDWELIAVEEPPMECRGTPRVQYGRTVLLLPPTVQTADWAAAAAEATMSERWTIGYSADDAGIGDLDKKAVVLVNSTDWGGDMDAWFDEYYPGTGYVAISASSPADMKAKLIALIGGGSQPDSPF